MALSEAQKNKIEEEEKVRAEIRSELGKENQLSRKHGIPALLSFFVPGLGQIVKGQVGKGILIFIAFIIGCFMLVLPGVIVWIWQLVDAYNAN